MKIENVEIRYIKMKLVAPFKTSYGVEEFEEHIIVKINSEGLTGWGEVPVEPVPLYSYETVQTAWHILSDLLIPAILKKDISRIEDHLGIIKNFRGHPMAKGGVETALYDLFAQREKKSLSQFLGGTRNKIDVGVSIGIQSSTSKLIEDITGYLNKGYKRIKIKIEPGNDIEYIKAVRKEYPGILFQVDANSAYTMQDLPLLKSMDEFDLLLIEQPLAHDDIYQHSLLQRELKTNLCLDESIHSLRDAEAALGMQSCRVINIKPARVSGIHESILIHNYCQEHNIPVWHGGMLESGIGRAANVALASLPNFTLPGDISASSRYYVEDIVDPLFELNNDGTISAPTGHGLGVNVINEKLERVTVRKILLK